LRHAQLKDFSCTSLCLPYCFMFRDDNSVWLDGVLCSEKTRAHHSHFLVGCPFGPRNGRSRARSILWHFTLSGALRTFWRLQSRPISEASVHHFLHDPGIYSSRDHLSFYPSYLLHHKESSKSRFPFLLIARAFLLEQSRWQFNLGYLLLSSSTLGSIHSSIPALGLYRQERPGPHTGAICSDHTDSNFLSTSRIFQLLHLHSTSAYALVEGWKTIFLCCLEVGGFGGRETSSTRRLPSTRHQKRSIATQFGLRHPQREFQPTTTTIETHPVRTMSPTKRKWVRNWRIRAMLTIHSRRWILKFRRKVYRQRWRKHGQRLQSRQPDCSEFRWSWSSWVEVIQGDTSLWFDVRKGLKALESNSACWAEFAVADQGTTHSLSLLSKPTLA
jgi:hypothetical protein